MVYEITIIDDTGEETIEGDNEKKLQSIIKKAKKAGKRILVDGEEVITEHE